LYDLADETQIQDGLYFSDDGGLNFTKVYDFDPLSWCNQWGSFPPFDVDKLAAANGLSLTSQFVIRFQQHDEHDFRGSPNIDGFYIDNVVVREPETEYAILPFEDGFESGEFKKAWSWSHPDSTVLNMSEIKPTGQVGITPNTKFEGQYGAFMGKVCDDNFVTNALDLHLNLSGQTQVELSFMLYDLADETQIQDGLYFSDDGGLNFTKVYDFDPSNYANSFQSYAINIGELVKSAGLSLSDSSVIRFQQHDEHDFRGSPNIDGFYIDNVKVQNTKLPFITSFSPGIAPVGREITITGINMNTVTEVTFAGADPVAGQALDSATLLVVVPANAQTGKISVTNEEGTTTSENSFVISDEEVAAPYNLIAESVSCFITLNWQDTTNNETGFIVERRLVDSTNFEPIATLGANSSSYADEAKALQNGAEYFYRVRAFSPLGNSVYSNDTSAIAIVSDVCGSEGETVPTAPTGLEANKTGAVDETEITLTWTNTANNASGVRVYRKREESGTYKEVAILGANEDTYVDLGLAFDVTYYYYVLAYNSAGESSRSNEDFDIAGNKVLSISDDLADVSELLRLYPNPAQNTLQFKLKNEQYGAVQLRVMNTLGQVQLNQTFNKNQLVVEESVDISQWKSGVYFVEIAQGSFRSVQRLAKQ